MILLPYNDERLYLPGETVQDVTLYPALIEKLRALRAEERAAGIAANQIGANIRLFVTKYDSFETCFNPTYRPLDGTGYTSKPESSITRRGWSTYVRRPDGIHAEWTNAKGELCQADLHAMDARVFCHMTDAADGKMLWRPPALRQMPLGISGE